MVRTQIRLEEREHGRLKAYAHRRGISLAEAVRRGVRELLRREQAAPSRELLVRRFLAVAGRHTDERGASDVAERHDDYLAEAFGYAP
ncbi:MAG: CopG family transcriptional regulator [Deltaproteobacteria bacterium]|nr:CopG family transcriptional regulator [Deltaproteobacteria bacterium]